MPADKRQIYIVDDDESVCRALKTLLISHNFEVATFNSSKSFFDSVPTDDFGCVILDIHMPGPDGWETQKKILDSGSKRPVIFVSAVKEDVSARALKVGAVGFLQKPFDGQTLVNLINVALAKNGRKIKK